MQKNALTGWWAREKVRWVLVALRDHVGDLLERVDALVHKEAPIRTVLSGLLVDRTLGQLIAAQAGIEVECELTKHWKAAR